MKGTIHEHFDFVGSGYSGEANPRGGVGSKPRYRLANFNLALLILRTQESAQSLGTISPSP
jgi:hypothetical protein